MLEITQPSAVATVGVILKTQSNVNHRLDFHHNALEDHDADAHVTIQEGCNEVSDSWCRCVRDASRELSSIDISLETKCDSSATGHEQEDPCHK